MSEHVGHGRLASPSFRDQENFWQASLKDPFNNVSNTSLDTVLHTRKRDLSLNSTDSQDSHTKGPLRVRHGNLLLRETSLSTMGFPESPGKPSPTPKTSKQMPHKLGRENDIPVLPEQECTPGFLIHAESLEEIDLNLGSSKANHEADEIEPERNLSFDANVERLSTRRSMSEEFSSQGGERKPDIIITDSTPRGQPFRRWMSNIRRKSSKIKVFAPRDDSWSAGDCDEREPISSVPQYEEVRVERVHGHQKTSSWSSSGFVTAVKSATVSLGPLSLAHQSRRTRRSTFLRSSKRSSGRSHRASLDSSQGSGQVVDEAAWARAIQRRRTLEELVSSEESYIADLKVLVNVSCLAHKYSQALSHIADISGLFHFDFICIHWVPTQITTNKPKH